MKFLIVKITSMRKLTIPVSDVLLNLNNIIFIQMIFIHKTKLSIISKYNLFEVVTFEIFDFESHKYERVDCFNWWCAFAP